MFLKPRRRCRRGLGFINNDSWVTLYRKSMKQARNPKEQLQIAEASQLYQPDDSWAASSISVQAAHLVTPILAPLAFGGFGSVTETGPWGVFNYSDIIPATTHVNSIAWTPKVDKPRAWEQHSTWMTGPCYMVRA